MFSQSTHGAGLRRGLALLSLALCVQFACASAQAQTIVGRPRLYLDCGRDCSDSYYRQALNYFDWVRDRQYADFAISVVSQVASNGGDSYTVTLRQPRYPKRPNIVRVVTTQPDDQPAVIREKILAAGLRCLFEALRGTQHENTFTLTLPKRSEQVLGVVEDGWDRWVFTPELAAEYEGETNQHFLKLLGTLTVRRITEAHKFRSTTRFMWRSTSYTLVDESGEMTEGEEPSTYDVTGRINSLVQRFLYAHSLGQHWALGGLVVGEHNEYANAKLHLRGGPVLEWNLFPYEENASRQLRFAYQAGAWFSRYYELTKYGRTKELRPYHALSLVIDLNQAWGGIQAAMQANSFIDKPRQFRLQAGIIFSLNIVAGLALQCEGVAAYIQDQIGLRRANLTEEQVFLETRELAKTFSVTVQFGFSYTFGSVHNTIVNPRFGRVDLEDD